MSRIPEVIDLDIQAERLMRTFGNNDDFQRVRGKCGDGLLSIADAQMRNKDKTAKAPSAGTDDLRKFLTSFVNVRNKISQLARDGYTLAAHEAERALRDPRHLMIGEIYPVNNTIPVTLVIFNPEMTLAVLKRGQPAGIRESWRLLHQSELPQDFPPVKKALFFYTDILETLHGLNEPLLEKVKQRIAKKNAKYVDLFESIVIPHNRRAQSTKRIPTTFAFAFYAKKENILKCFSHEEQSKIATWQFNLPKTSASTLVFGLHLQAEHDYWQRKRAPLCSLNITCGYGAIAYPGEAYHCFDKKSRKFKGTRIIVTN